MFKTRCLQDDDAHLSIVDNLSCSFRLNMWNSLDVSADQNSSGQIPVSTSACAVLLVVSGQIIGDWGSSSSSS